MDETKDSINAPADANTGCVGPSAATAGQASACQGCPNQTACSTGQFAATDAQQQDQETLLLKQSLANVSHVVLVLSGKGGVGKSTVAAQLCHTLSSQGYAVGLLDIDLCGPSAPRMILGENMQQTIHKSASGHWLPVYQNGNLAVMSISFMLQDMNQAVVWRGPRKNALIQQFLTQVDWTGDTDGLDYLIIDTPPGTSDEHISTVQYLERAGAVSGAIVVTTPEEISLADVRKELSFCSKTRVPILGVIENMSSYQTQLKKCTFANEQGEDCTSEMLTALAEKCPEALDTLIGSKIFSTSHGGAEKMAADYNVPFWGRVPLDPDLLKACEDGKAYVSVDKDAAAGRSSFNFVYQRQMRHWIQMHI
jgi:Mrp family chromosome partitioning ATPase